jgi:hypothetical protein
VHPVLRGELTLANAILNNVIRAVRNPNGCLMVENILKAVATECERIGSEPFNSMGGHFVWQAIARDIRSCVDGIEKQTYDRHLERGNVYDQHEKCIVPTIVGLTKE